MSRPLFTLLLGMVVTSCASLGMRTEGVSGPIAWRATDLKIQAVGEAAGVIGISVSREAYSFTLVLQETQGTALTFTKVAYRIDGGPGLQPFFAERVGQWRLRPQGELRWPLSSTWSCTSTDCVRPGFFAPVWHIILTGTDNRGQEVRVVIDLKLPYNPDAMEKR
jgi:hypothetical protein